VISEPVLVDTGPLVALLRESDQYHAVCVEQTRHLNGPMLTCWPVMTEAAWLLKAVRPLLQMLQSGQLICVELDATATDWLENYAARYANLKPQLADLALAYLAEHRNLRIFTLDRRDFLIYRTSDGKPFQILPQSV